MMHLIQRKCPGFPPGFQLPCRLKARRGLLFRHESCTMLFSVALCLTTLASVVPFECSTRRMRTAWANSVLGLETDPERSGTYSGATELDGGATGVNDTSLGMVRDTNADTPLGERSKRPSVAAHLSKIQLSGQRRRIVASGILASVVLAVLLGTIFLNSGRNLRKAITPASSAALQVSTTGLQKRVCFADSEGDVIESLFWRTSCSSVLGDMKRERFRRLELGEN
ncbi:Toxoplasma gondii family C protein [Toxoplasma gondii GT1]|uniref:Toxoplasma gondii family C protein n=4 Tax=Toxoplasma gondii TaxID=5811 RepID=S7VNU3_TOXGG|nr:Toxoplasma gondii family C protein [Toxoplasma gondii GT1]